MVSGSSVYREIKNKVSELEGDLENFNEKVLVCENAITENMDKREITYAQLATFYLPDFEANSLRATITEVQSDVKKIFEQKQIRRKELETIMQSSQSERKKIEQKLDPIVERLNEKVKERQELTKKVSEEIKQNQEYIQIRTQAEQTNQNLIEAKERVKDIEREAREKIPAYKQNKIFRYLETQEFGTEMYEKKGLIAKLDKWVAKVINYEEAKQSYDFLKSVPAIIQEEVDKKQKDLEELTKTVKKIEKDSCDKNGLTKVLEEGNKLGEERSVLLGQIENYNSIYSARERERRVLDSTKDEYYQRALGKLKSYLNGKTIQELKQKASETENVMDDNLVEKIEYIDSNIRELKQKAKRLKQERDEFEEKLDGLKDLESKYKRADYESSRSRFNSRLDMNNFITGYLIGKYSREDVWGHIKQHHHFESDDDSSSYSHHSSSSSYHSSSSGFSSGSGFGGGGFSSGGGFGGGGFSSGKGF
jgi:uncharacterized membrane protein YgcG